MLDYVRSRQELATDPERGSIGEGDITYHEEKEERLQAKESVLRLEKGVESHVGRGKGLP